MAGTTNKAEDDDTCDNDTRKDDTHDHNTHHDDHNTHDHNTHDHNMRDNDNNPDNGTRVMTTVTKLWAQETVVVVVAAAYLCHSSEYTLNFVSA